jgi:AcrR family transcriptional regulator
VIDGVSPEGAAGSEIAERQTPPRRPTDRRRDLVAAAYRRIASDGFEGLRTRDVAADVGVNVATLHYYFPTKEALIRGVIGQAMQRFRETIPDDGSPAERLRGHLRALAGLLKADRQLWAVLGELVLRAPRDTDLGRTFRQTDEYWHRTLRDLISAAVAQGAIRPAFEPDDAAALIIVAIKGLGLPTVAGFQPELTDQVFRLFERLLGLQSRTRDRARRQGTSSIQPAARPRRGARGRPPPALAR